MKVKGFVLFFAIALIPLFSFFRSGLPLTHDGQDQVARIANFYQSLSEGNLIPRWAANLNWGYGHPILMFLYPLPSYFASIFRVIGFSFVDSTKIVFILSFILSGFFMYLWIKEVWGKEAGFVAGLLYVFAPYRFVDLYVRGAIGECWAFVWPPLICWFALKLSQKTKWRYLAGGSLSLAALILSHNALSLMFLPIIFGYMVFLIFQSKPKILNTFYFIFYTFFGFALSAFFWLPAFWEGKYTLRDIVTKGNIIGFEPFSRLLLSPWSYSGTGSFSVQLGILQWLAIILALFLIWQFWRRKDKFWPFLLFLFVYFWLAIFLILPCAQPLYFKISLMQKFQFAWRWLSLAIFPPAVFAGAAIFLLPQKFKLFCTFFFILASLYLNKNYWHAKDYLYKPESFYTQAYPGTTDTGESAPRWSVRFMENFPRFPIEVIEGKAEIKNYWRKTSIQKFAVNVEVPSRIVVNTLYFPGWKVLVSTKSGPTSGRDNQPAEIQFQDPVYRGLMTFWVSKGEHYVTVQFGETRLRKMANLVSLLGLGGLVSSGFVLKLLKK